MRHRLYQQEIDNNDGTPWQLTWTDKKVRISHSRLPVLWEAPDACVAHIAGFLGDVENGRDVSNPVPLNGHAPPLLDTLAATTQWFFGLPSTLTGAAFDSLTIARQIRPRSIERPPLR